MKNLLPPIKTYKRVYQNSVSLRCRDIFLYLSARYALIINVIHADKYKNMSLHVPIMEL